VGGEGDHAVRAGLREVLWFAFWYAVLVALWRVIG
jgi:hypothetical protein